MGRILFCKQKGLWEKIPSSMMTQHPDAASRYIPIQEEVDEAILGLSASPKGLGIEEIMIDFEGKLTPYHQTGQIVLGLLSKGIIPGKEVYVTPRVPSASKETVFRQLMALMSVVEANVRASEWSKTQAVKEIIIPMCENEVEIVEARKRISDVIQLGHREFGIENDPNLLQPIPLVEEVPELLNIDSMLSQYVERCRDLGLLTERIRLMVGRSDPALSYGMVPAVLAAKVAIAKAFEIGARYGIEIAPILGAGSLPFRGHISLESIESVLATYPGVRTITIQSAMRYDHGFDKTRRLAALLKERLTEKSVLYFTKEELKVIYEIVAIFTKHYLFTFSKIIDLICKISDIVPQQRDRLTRYGALGYARDIARPEKLAAFLADDRLCQELQELHHHLGLPLPRAISYVAAMYSIGVPPEFVGTGRGLTEVREKYGETGIKRLIEYYPSIKSDMKFAGRFLGLSVAKNYLPAEALIEIKSDVEAVGEILGITLGPQNPDDEFYFTLLETAKPILRHLIGLDRPIVKNQREETQLVCDWIIRQGKMRGSLG